MIAKRRALVWARRLMTKHPHILGAKAAENYAQENGIQYSDGTVVKDVLNSFLNQFGYEIAD